MLNLELTTEGGIYRIVRLPNGPIYIGSAINIRTRARSHVNMLNRGVHTNPHLRHAWKLAGGAPAFEIETVATCPRAELLTREQWWVDYYRAHGIKLYNSRPIVDSQLGFRHTAQTKARMSAAKLKMTDETRDRIAESNRAFARAHPEAYAGRNAGHKWTAEQKEKLRSRRSPMLGRTHSPEVRERLRAAGRARPPLFGGRTHSEETKAKMRASAQKRTATAETRRRMSTSIKAAWARRKESSC